MLLLKVEQLERFLSLLPGSPRPHTQYKADMIRVIDEALSGLKLGKYLRLLSENERAALAAIVHSEDRQVDFRRLKAKLGSEKNAAIWDRQRNDVCEKIELLTIPGGFFEINRVVPLDLAERLRRHLPAPGISALHTHKDLPEEAVCEPDNTEDRDFGVNVAPYRQRDREMAAQRELLAVLQCAENDHITLTTSIEHPDAASIRRLTAVLPDGDFYAPMAGRAGHSRLDQIKAYAWPWLMRAGDLVRKNTPGVLELTKRGRAAMAAPTADTLRSLWNSWIANNIFDEVARIDLEYGQNQRAKRFLTQPRYRRERIASALKHCPVGEWVAVEEFSRFMLANEFDFEISSDLPVLGVRNTECETLEYLETRGWQTRQESYLYCFLFEFAATLGLIDVCYRLPDNARPGSEKMLVLHKRTYFTRYDGLAYFRLNPLGAYCLGLSAEYERALSLSSSDFRISVRSNLSLEVDGVPGMAQVLLLEKYATCESETQWRLDRQRITRIVERGFGIDELRGFLASHDDQPLPELVDGFLAQVERDGRAVTVGGRAVIFKCADSAVADRIAADRACSKMCQRVGDTELVVAEKLKERFLKAVRDAGYGIVE